MYLLHLTPLASLPLLWRTLPLMRCFPPDLELTMHCGPLQALPNPSFHTILKLHSWIRDQLYCSGPLAIGGWFFLLSYNVLLKYVVYLCVHACARIHRGQKKSIGSLGAGVYRMPSVWCGRWDDTLLFWIEQQVLLIWEPSLRPPAVFGLGVWVFFFSLIVFVF